MDGPSRSGGLRQSRRSRSQRDRERRRRRADLGASSPSSGSDQELGRGDSFLGANGGEGRPVFPGARHRPPRRRKRESVSCEEDIIDGFAIASFISLEALEMDCSLKLPERAGMFLGRGSKRKRGLDENGGPLSEPEEGAPATYTNSSSRNDKKKRDAKVPGNLMETGYICDAESESGDKASDNDMEPTFTVSTREVLSNPVSLASTVSNGCALLPSNGGPCRLAVTPRVSGLQRSQERSLELPYPEPTSTSSSLLLPRSSASVSTSLVEQNGNGSLHHRLESPPQHKPKSFLSFPGRTQTVYGMGLNNRNSTSVKPPSSSASSSSIRPPTPSTSVSASHGPSGAGVLRPSSRPSPGALFTPPPGLPPPPPLMQASPRSADQALNPHFQSADRDGRTSGSSAGVSASSASAGATVSSSSSGSSSRAVQAQTNMPPMAYQFHQHNHQHQHTHTHQHFLHPPAPAPPMFEKYTGKIDGLFRHSFFPQYPPPVAGIQPVLPPTGPFSSMQGAFQPKLVALQGPAPDMTARLGVVPPHLQPKDPRITDPFAPSLKVSNKPGKWCAMHVRVAWMILRHQEKVKLMQADPQKLDFRNDLMPRLPGPGGIGGIGGLAGLGGPLPPTHDLTRPGSLFAAASGVNPSSTSFIPPSTPHSSFLTPATHLDQYGRSPPFPPLGALGTGAFGGLGSPSLGASSVFGHKAESSANAVGPLGNPHDPWNRLHVPPPPFASGPAWAKGLEKRDERDRMKEMERRELTHIKDEKDRDSLLYGRQPVRMSPSALKHRSNTPSSHMNGLGPLSGVAGQSDGQNRERERERDRERERERESEKRQHSGLSSRAPASTSSAPDRPRSSTSSVLATPPPRAPSASSPLDLFARQPHALSSENPHSTQRESSGPSSSSSSVNSLSIKKPDRTTTPVSKQTSLLPGVLNPSVKVKEERKEEPEPVPISLPHPAMPPHSFEPPNSRHTHHPSTPSSTLSLTPTSVPLPPPTPHPPHHHLSLLDRSRIDAYLGGAGSSAGLVVGGPGDRFVAHPHTPPQGHAQPPHSFPWDPWRELAAQQQQQQQHREVLALRSDPHLALRSDPHLSRLLQHQHARYLERAAVAAAVAVGPHHPGVPTSTSSASASATRPEFGLMSHPFDRPPQVGAPGGGLLDDVRYFGAMHPHLSTPHLPSPSHAAHLEQLHAGLLSHSQLHPPGGSAGSPHHPGLYSRLGPLHPHSHVHNGILTKTPGLVGPLSVGAPPPLIPSATRSATPPRSSRLGGAGDLALFSTHKDGESR